MYSYEDRLRAVLLYINQGKRDGITIRQLGYPTKNTLKVWYLAYERSRDFPRVYQRKPKYTAKQRDLAVDHFLSHGRSIAVTIQALGYPSKSLLGSWVQQAHPELCPRIGQAHKPLSPQAKHSAVMALCLREGSAKAVAKELGVSRPALY
jgi:transposase-like protein